MSIFSKKKLKAASAKVKNDQRIYLSSETCEGVGVYRITETKVIQHNKKGSAELVNAAITTLMVEQHEDESLVGTEVSFYVNPAIDQKNDELVSLVCAAHKFGTRDLNAENVQSKMDSMYPMSQDEDGDWIPADPVAQDLLVGIDVKGKDGKGKFAGRRFHDPNFYPVDADGNRLSPRDL